ncbi:NUDIX hydrolase [Swingsia samuiensis]|uniref:NrtR DNA-binding winged helix domain-containing protein n=1 Tax=Swingsia samuiensis TaxID=1293412 RepID=A0A4Y6UJJ8_9PROT|nr:hypothetical protein [Swingsia samuiensis]QDH17773.1 hypothetical protein E3D00_09490 [Swingsia samuiensis]
MANHVAICRAELVAVLNAVQHGVPKVLTLQEGKTLPAGPLETEHTSLQRGLRQWVEWQTGFLLGHVEQLYTFWDPLPQEKQGLIRASYMALTREDISSQSNNWRSWYDYFPWEDRRSNEGAELLKKLIEPLHEWAANDLKKLARLRTVFGLKNQKWDDAAVLERYELLWEAGLVAESPLFQGSSISDASMLYDHRRILATAISRLRAKIRYTPVIFQLVPERFTLFQLQQTMEALAGRYMHKQNFRRLVLNQGLVKETDYYENKVQGRPARLYQFCDDAADHCYLDGAKQPLENLS